MLSFRVRQGDDIFFGLEGQRLEDYKQVIFHRVDNGVATIMTDEVAIDIPLSEVPKFTAISVHNVKMSVKENNLEQSTFIIGMRLPDNVVVLRGRKYRRSLSE